MPKGVLFLKWIYKPHTKNMTVSIHILIQNFSEAKHLLHSFTTGYVKPKQVQTDPALFLTDLIHVIFTFQFNTKLCQFSNQMTLPMPATIIPSLYSRLFLRSQNASFSILTSVEQNICFILSLSFNLLVFNRSKVFVSSATLGAAIITQPTQPVAISFLHTSCLDGLFHWPLVR